MLKNKLKLWIGEFGNEFGSDYNASYFEYYQQYSYQSYADYADYNHEETENWEKNFKFSPSTNQILNPN